MLEMALRQALGEAGDRIFLIDTAAKYGNQQEVALALRQHPRARVGSKVNHPGKVAEDLAEMVALFGVSLHRVLLHRPMPLRDWQVLEQAKKNGLVQEIGVCNYSADLLEQLLATCEVPPDVVQNEFHPCLSTPVMRLCHRRGIRFEAHSVMAANTHLLPKARLLGVSPAEVAIAYCLAQGADVCFSTANLTHLRQDVAPALQTLLTQDDVAELAQLAFAHPIRIYRAQGSLAMELAVDELHEQLLKDVDAFQHGEPFSDLCISIPKTHRGSQAETAKLLAKRFFPEVADASGWQKFDGLLHRMRKVIEARDQQKRAARRAAFPKVCTLPREAVADPDALPVNIPQPEGFEPFLDELRQLAMHHIDSTAYPRHFEKGTLFPDGRMDLCKQVIQPRFAELCKVVEAGTTVKHFLLGNNVVFRDGSRHEIEGRMDALLRLLHTNPAIETWYLAGNGIDASLAAPLADGFRTASHLKALWLKMNALKTGAQHFGELAASHTGLELLDLFNTGLGDDGIRAFRNGLRPHGSRVLKHLYLSINDISDGGAVEDVIRLLPNLESFYLGINFLGDGGAARVLGALADHTPLQRLEFGANGMTDVSLPLLLTVAESTPLQYLKLGSYKSTRYFDGQPNDLRDIGGLVRLARAVKYLDLDGAVEALDLGKLEEQLRQEAPNTHVFATQGPTGAKKVLRREGQSGGFQKAARLGHPQPFVDNIQSIYRNQM